MKYGMPSLVEFNSIDENVEFAKQNNLDFIELNMDLPYCYDMDLSKYNMEFTMHLSEEINVADLNESLRKSYVDEAIREIKIGIKNNIKKYNVHLDSGVYFTLPNGKYFLNEKYSDMYLNQINKNCQRLNKLARDNNIEINFENTKIQDFMRLAIDIIKKYDYLGFTLDIGHNEKNGNKALPIFRKTNRIRHIHLHDYDGKSDHLPLGKGKIDINKYTFLLKNNYVVVEIKTTKDLIDSLKKIRDE